MHKGHWTANRENSFVVQPVGQMDESEFENHVQELLFNPTDESGQGPFPHTQDAAIVKLPSQQQAFLLKFPDGQSPVGPQSYSVRREIGDSAEPRTAHDDYFTQMKYGPRATPSMMDRHDQPDDVGNSPPGTGKPGAGLPGQRFVIKNKEAMSHRLKQLVAALAEDFGKTTRWRALCKEQHATTECDQIRLAEQVLAEPPMGTVAGGYAQWAKLHGAKDQPAPPYKPTGF